MKHLLLLAALIGSGILSSCSSGEKKENAASATENTAQEKYACPMKCTNETFDKPGQCPSCGMDLEKVNP